MSAVLENEAGQPADSPEKKKVGWPKGVPRGPRKPKVDGEAAPAQRARTRGRPAKAPADPSTMLGQWQQYRVSGLDPRGKVADESRKAYFNGAMDLMALIVRGMGEMPPGFMDWVQQCQRGMLSKD
jgi:hypothetical protein